MTPNPKRLIEVAFPLKQASLDSVHEKNVRHGHISTLHIWPARRPLAASRAALITTLLPDPGVADKRKALLERMAGCVVEKIDAELPELFTSNDIAVAMKSGRRLGQKAAYCFREGGVSEVCDKNGNALVYRRVG